MKNKSSNAFEKNSPEDRDSFTSFAKKKVI